MNSITLSVGYILTVLMIHVSATDYQFLSETTATLDNPFNFIYVAHSDYLLMEITLENIPPSVTEVYVKHNNFGKTGTSRLKAVTIENNTGKTIILGNLAFNEISVEVQLRNKTGLCAKKTVADGRNLGSWKFITLNNGRVYLDNPRRQYDKSGTCLAHYNCNIVVDFKNTCADRFMCYLKASQYICTIQNAKPPYNLFQTYDDDSTIGDTMTVQYRNLKLTITLELFDVNTTINVAEGKNIIRSQKIVAPNSIKDYNATTLKYSETTEAEFKCQENVNDPGKVVYVHVGVINTTNNKIKTHNKTLIQKKFNLADNGTILCCLYYVQEAILQKEITFTRFVLNKTMLIYQRNESIQNVANQPTEHAIVDQAMSSTERNDYSWLLYVFVTLIGVSVLVVAFFIISKKRWFKNSPPVEEAVEFDNQAHQNQVLYADLNFATNAGPPQDQSEESHYARIIGELHPL